MTASKYLIIIAGPTAVGKTDLAIQLAHQFNAEIISADSRQYYKELSIGTAKPSLEDQKRIIHHFVDSLSIHDPYSIGQFERDVLVKLEDRFIEMDTIIMTGGSGMHIRAISHGLDEFPFVPTKVRDRIAMLFKQHGIQVLQELLQAKDPEYAQMVDMDNPHRLIRAISVMEVSRRPYSSFLHHSPKERPFEIIYILLERDRPELYDRINIRVDSMIQAGLEKEAQRLFPFRKLQALNTIGYKELFELFDGKIERSTAIELIKRNSRRYAKRQMTWFRNETYWEKFHPKEKMAIVEYIQKRFSSKPKSI